MKKEIDELTMMNKGLHNDFSESQLVMRQT